MRYHRKKFVLRAVGRLSFIALGLRDEALLSVCRGIAGRLASGDEGTSQIFDFLQRGHLHLDPVAASYRVGLPGKEREGCRNAFAEKDGSPETGKQRKGRASREENEGAGSRSSDHRLRYTERDSPARDRRTIEDMEDRTSFSRVPQPRSVARLRKMRHQIRLQREPHEALLIQRPGNDQPVAVEQTDNGVIMRALIHENTQ